MTEIRLHASARGISSLQRLKEENSRLLHEDIENRAEVYRALPEVVTLNHTDICNLKCIMCPRKDRQGKNRLPRRVLDYVANELFPTAKKAVLTTSGGEPLAVDFDFLLDKALTFEVKLDVVTNGVLLTPALYERARPALDHLNISMDSHIPEVYEHIRRGARFERLYENVAAIRDARRTHPDSVLLSLSAVVMRSNLRHLPDFVRFAKDIGADGVILQRVRAYLNPTPEEIPEASFSKEEIIRCLEETREAAEDGGINLFMSEFGYPGIMVKELRPKVPIPIEDKGLCWFVAQNFGIMYTGDVYPCCYPNDHCWGNVIYQDFMSVWNGKVARKLRKAHLSGRGTLFCSGCPNAPHLEAPKRKALLTAAQRVRMVVKHFQNTLYRGYAKRFRHPIFNPPPPPLKACDGGFEVLGRAHSLEPFPHATEALAVNAEDQILWFVSEGVLYRSSHAFDGAEPVLRLKSPPCPKCTCLIMLTPEVALAGFEEDGRLFRIELDHEPPRFREVLALSNPRSFVRGTLARAPSGDVWVGEYGIFPGARCANLYVSRDRGETFQLVRRFEEAKHIHALHALAGSGRLVVTTGDLAHERRLYLGSKKGNHFRTVQNAWSGYVAVAETENFVHFGTDLPQGNGFLRFYREFDAPPEFRALPQAIDYQVRRIIALDSNSLVAVCGMELNFKPPLQNRPPPLLLSEDEGETWKVIHIFSEDGSDVPEGVEVLKDDPRTLITYYTPKPLVIRLSSD